MTQAVTMFDRDGAPVQVPVEGVADAFRSGSLAFRADQDVEVKGADGSIQIVKGADAPNFFGSPDSLTSVIAEPGSFAAREEQQQYSGIGGTGLAVAGGVARGATFGASDLLAQQLGFQDKLEKAQRYNPVASLGGELAGAVIPALLTEGGSLGATEASLTGTAARVASAPVRAASALGRGAEGLTGRGLAAIGLGDSAVAKIAKGAVGQAVEGGAFGVGQAISDTALHNDDLTAEKLVAGAKEGALVGGAFGGLISGVGVGLSKTQEAAAKLFSKNASGETELTNDGFRLYAKLHSGEDPAVAKLLKESADSKEARTRLLQNADDALQTEQRKLTAAIDNVQPFIERASAEFEGPAKLDKIRAAMKPDNALDAFEAAATTTSELRSRLKSMLDAPAAYGSKANTQKALGMIDHVESKLVEAHDGKMSAEAFQALDELKRQFGKWSKPGQMTSSSDLDAVAQFRDMYEQNLMPLLENESIWGYAAKLQKDINGIWSPQIQASKDFEKRFLTDYGRNEFDKFAQGKRVDTNKIASYVGQYGRASNDLSDEALTTYIGKSKRFLDAIEKVGELTPGGLKAVREAKLEISKFESASSAIKEKVAQVNVLKAAKELEASSSIGGATGLALDIVAHPVSTMTRLAAVEATVSRVNERIKNAVGEALSGAAKRASRVAEARAPAVVVAFGAGKGSLPDRYDAAIKTLGQAGQPTDSEPGIHARAQAVQQRAIDFLRSKVPAVSTRPSLSVSLQKAQPAPEAMAKFMRYWKAAKDAPSVLEDLRDGKISREGVETLKAVYPSMYQEIVSDVVGKTSEMKIPYNTRIQLGILLGVPTDPSLSPQSIMVQQRVYADNSKNAPPPKPMRNSRKSDYAESFASFADKIGNGE